MAASAAAAGIHQPDPAAMAGAGNGKDSIKEMRQHLADELAAVRDLRRRVEDRLHTHSADQQTLVSSLQTLVPGLASSLDLSLRLVSAFNARPPPPSAAAATAAAEPAAVPVFHKDGPATSPKPYDIPAPAPAAADAGDDPTLLVRSMVAVCLLERVPFAPIDSAAVLRKLEADASATAAERAALLHLGGESGAIAAVEAALRAIAEDTGAVELEDFGVSGKSRVLVFEIDRSRLVKELPESRSGSAAVADAGGVPRPPPVPAATAPEMWAASASPPMFPGPGTARPRMMGLPPRGGAMVAPSPMHRPPSALPAPAPAAGPNLGRLRTEEDDMKDLEALLNKKSFREMQKSKQGEELLDLIHRPTAKETAVAAKVGTLGWLGLNRCYTLFI